MLHTPRQVKEARQRRPRIVWSHLYEMPRISKWNPKQISGYWGLEGKGKGEWLLTRAGFLFGGDENVQKLIVVMVVLLCEYTESHWTVYLGRVDFMGREFYITENKEKSRNVYNMIPFLK